MTVSITMIVEALLKNKNVLLYGPPGTGKSHLMKEVAKAFASTVAQRHSVGVVIDEAEERNPFTEASFSGVETRWVTFHQGYSYEDFIVGMRPVVNEDAGFYLEPKAGVLVELAAAAKNGAGLLLIDEINRGNTSKIFGEFITLMEPAKRLTDAGEITDETVTLRLPYLSGDDILSVKSGTIHEEFSRDFNMPARVYTLASMNSVDKSIAPIDTALRRRFHIVNISPTEDDFRIAVGLPTDATPPSPGEISATSIAFIAASAAHQINRGIAMYLGPEFLIGQWYFSNLAGLDVDESKFVLASTWMNRIMPQLLELFHGRYDQLIAVLGKSRVDHPGSGIRIVEPNEDEIDLGGSPYIEMGNGPDPDQVVGFLRQFVPSVGGRQDNNVDVSAAG